MPASSTAARHALGTFPVGNAWALPMACLAVSRAYCMLRAADALRVRSNTGAEYFLRLAGGAAAAALSCLALSVQTCKIRRKVRTKRVFWCWAPGHKAAAIVPWGVSAPPCILAAASTGPVAQKIISKCLSADKTLACPVERGSQRHDGCCRPV